MSKHQIKTLELFESLVTVYSKTGRIPHHYKPNYVIKQYVKMLTKKRLL